MRAGQKAKLMVGARLLTKLRAKLVANLRVN